TDGTARETWCMLDMWETWAHEQRLQPESGKLKQADVKGHTSAKILDPDRNYPLDEDKVETDCFSTGLSIVCSGKIEGRLVDMLVDTGSVYTLISEALWETLRSNLCTSDRYRCAAGSSTNVPSTLELVREQHKVVSANGEPIDILGKTQLSICIGQEVGIQSVLVARDLAQECILGVDFMRAHKLIIDFDTMALKTKTTNICLKKGNANLACNIKSAKNRNNSCWT
ncbi:Hypothetical predicted protein, partial [Mytilus galloprovincialis]